MGRTQRDRVFDRLVELTYACVLDDAGWPTLIRALAQASGRQTGSLLVWDQREAPRIGSFSLLDASLVAAYHRDYCHIDPTREHMAERAAGVWYDDFVDHGAARIASDPFYQEFQRSHRLQGISCLKLYEQDRAGAYLSLLTEAGVGQPGDAEQQLLRRLAPHLLQAARLSRHIQQLQLTLGRQDALLARSTSPLWLTDGEGRIHYANPAAMALASQADAPLQVQGSRLQLRQGDAALGALMRQAIGLRGAARAGRLPLPPPAHGAVLVMPLSAHAPTSLATAQPMALVVWPQRQPPAGLLTELFGLTQAECRLAQHLLKGLGPEQCAQALALSIHTVRTQMRALFLKTDTHRQAELVSLLGELGAD